MKIIAMIPARMGSSRFPGKPMAKLLGKPMIGHVYERVRKCASLSEVIVATCDDEIASYVSSIGGRAIMTGSHHERASDRCAEALAIVEREDGLRYDIVVMVQGDEPMTVPEMIDEAVTPMIADGSIQVVNLLGTIATKEEFEDRNCIKVVCDRNSDAICFSREPIPTQTRFARLTAHKQVCIIPFRRDYLIRYTELEPTPLEIAESVDMMRILENGERIRMVPTNHSTHAIDTPEDLKRVEKLMSLDAG